LIKKKYFKFFIKVIISAAILILLFTQNDSKIIFNEFISIYGGVLIISLLFIIASWFFQFFRYHLIVNKQKKYFRFSESVKLIFIGDALNTILPAGTGEIMKSHYAYLQAGDLEHMYTSSFIEKAYAVHSIILIALLPLWVKGHSTILYFSVFLWSLLTFLLFSNKPILNLVQRLPFITEESKNNIKNTMSLSIHLKLKCILSSTSLWMCAMMGFLFLMWSNQLNVSLSDVYYTFPILAVSRLFPFTLNGIGVQEAVLVLLLSDYGINAEQSIALGLQYRVISHLIPALIGAGIILFNKKSLKF